MDFVKIVEILSKLANIIPLLIQIAEKIFGSGEGEKKKEMVVSMAEKMVGSDPALKPLIDNAVEFAVAKGFNKGGVRAPDDEA